MGTWLSVTEEDLDALKAGFHAAEARSGEGLQMREFVELVSKRVPEPTEGTSRARVGRWQRVIFPFARSGQRRESLVRWSCLSKLT